MLRWVGLTYDFEQARAQVGAPYSRVRRWLREGAEPPPC